MRLLFLLVFFSLGKSYGQFLTTNARLNGMANAQVAVRDLFSRNQGNLALLKEHEIGSSIQQPFLIHELNEYYLNGVYISNWGVVGLRTFRAGSSNLTTTSMGIAYGKQLFDQLSAGVQVGIQQYHLTHHPNNYNYAVELGLNYSISDELSLGLHAAEPTSYTLTNDVRLEFETNRTISFGTVYRLPNFLISTEVNYNYKSDYILKAGVEYKLYDFLFLRLGTDTERRTLHTGFGIAWEALKLDFSIVQHPDLGASPSISISYVFNKNEK